MNPIINGWCSWFYANIYVTEDEVLRNAEYAARHLKPYGFEYMQIDHGYQRAFGDWEGNERFPHGMKWLAQRLHEMGLKAGLWVAPYVISEGAEVHREHPEWLLRNRDGSIKVCGNGGWGFGRELALDITHPGAAAWMRQLFETMSHDWGYSFFKMDFVEWTLFAADQYHDPTVSRAAAYRKVFEIIRQAVGPDVHLLDCGPPEVTVGLLDSTRIELDRPLVWSQYTGYYNSSAPAAAKRYYFNNRSWINDADCLGLTLMDIPEACGAASIIGLSGGTMLLSDRLFELNPARLEIAQKVLPAYGEAAQQVDLFERDRQRFLPCRYAKANGIGPY